MNQFSSSDWQRLRALRDRFLSDASEAYWTPGDLELYDATFAQRIGWKWDGVLRTLDRAGWKPESKRLIDWGCGTGIAGRAVAEWTGIREASVFDQSASAMTFAAGKLRGMGITASPTRAHDMPPGTLLLISHVAGELTGEELTALVAYAADADEILWVEPGSRDISLRLTAARDALQKLGHHLIAPCTHDLSCPMNTADHDWCHFFARPPSEIFQSAFWREFSTRLEIDLRALPYSFIATSRKPVTWPTGAERLIGHPRMLKAHCELLCCGAEGLTTRMLQKRDSPGLFKAFSRDHLDGAFVWQRDSAKPGRVRGGEEAGLTDQRA